MSHTACTEPQCLYKGDLYLLLPDILLGISYHYVPKYAEYLFVIHLLKNKG